MNAQIQRIVALAAVLLPLAGPASLRGAQTEKQRIAEHAAAAEALIDKLPAKAKKGLSQPAACRMLGRAYGHAGLFDRMQALAGKVDTDTSNLLRTRVPGFRVVHGQWLQARQSLEQMARENSPHLSLAWTLAIMQGMEQDIARSLALAEKAPAGKRRFAYVYAVRQAIINGDLALANSLSARAGRQLPKEQRQAAKRQIEPWLEAGKLAALRRKPNGKDKSLMPRVGLIGWTWARKGRTAQAERLATSLPSGYWRAKILAALAQTYQRTGNKIPADRAQAEARQAIADIADPSSAVAYLMLDLARLQAADGDLSGAMETISQALNKANEITQKTPRAASTKRLQGLKGQIQSSRLEAMILARQLDTALEEIRKHPDALRPKLLADLRQSLGKIGMDDQFDQILARVDDPARRLAYHVEMILRLSGKQPG